MCAVQLRCDLTVTFAGVMHRLHAAYDQLTPVPELNINSFAIVESVVLYWQQNCA